MAIFWSGFHSFGNIIRIRMRKTLYVLLSLALLMSHQLSSAQNYSTYNSYTVNPFLYNPAEAATDYLYVYLNHRQQWMGFEGAPVLTTANVSTLLNETRAGIGFKASSFKRGILNTTDFNFSYAYGVPFNQKNTLYFGLSAGAISNQINTTQPAAAADPAIANLGGNNFQPAGNFGMLFRSTSGINMGLVLPQLFSPKFNSTNNFDNTSPSPFDNIIISTYYKKKLEGKKIKKGSRKGMQTKVMSADNYAPLEFYVLYKYSKLGTSQLEGTLKINLTQNFWLGGTYRQSYGFAGSLGFSLKRFQFAYSYEPGNQPEPAFSRGSHEIQLGLRLGKAKKFRRVTPTFKSTVEIQQSEQHTARFQQTEEDPDNIEGKEKTKKKYLVVIRSYADFNRADAYKKLLLAEKYNANVFYNPKDRKYYVHVLESDKKGDAQEEARNLKKYTKLREARVVEVSVAEKEQ
jgi:type IX secretion system PorP/SprF family membrane protein